MPPLSTYTTQALHDAYARLGLGSGDAVYITGNFGQLGFHESRTKAGTLDAHLGVLRQLVGADGTLAVPTHTFSLCNTDRPFDPQASPSERGPFTEHVRRQPGSVRQFHPFASVTALGAAADAICGRCTRHAYGPNTPFARLIEADAWFVSIALPPQRTCSIVHHVEMAMGVPYRYTKEFLHPVQRPEGVRTEPFYLLVTHRAADLERDRNEKIFRHPQLGGTVRETALGMNRIWAYRMRDFEQAAVDCLTDDIYAWLKRPPAVRPYQK